MMAIYWCTEALPLPATALTPMFLSPMLGLMSSKEIAINYLTVSEWSLSDSFMEAGEARISSQSKSLGIKDQLKNIVRSVCLYST